MSMYTAMQGTTRTYMRPLTVTAPVFTLVLHMNTSQIPTVTCTLDRFKALLDSKRTWIWWTLLLPSPDISLQNASSKFTYMCDTESQKRTSLNGPCSSLKPVLCAGMLHYESDLIDHGLLLLSKISINKSVGNTYRQHWMLGRLSEELSSINTADNTSQVKHSIIQTSDYLI